MTLDAVLERPDADTSAAGPPAKRRRNRGGRVLVIACGAVVPEVQAVLAANGLGDIDIRAVPASYHNRPEKIAPAVERLIVTAKGRYERVFVAFGDCGTAGALDRVLEREGVERLPGAHCYAFFSGVDAFAASAEDDLRSFFLTDFLARHFESLVVRGLGLDRHPELTSLYFGHYERIVYLSQSATPALLAAAEAAAHRLGLGFEHRPVGYGDLAPAVAGLAPGGKPTAKENFPLKPEHRLY